MFGSYKFGFKINEPKWKKSKGNRNKTATKAPTKTAPKTIKVMAQWIDNNHLMNGGLNSNSIPFPILCTDYLGNSNDSFCSSDISMDGSNFDHLDEATSDTLSLQNLDLQTAHLHNNLLDNPTGHMTASTSNVGNINPIDKLYLMQNSYFNSEQWRFSRSSNTITDCGAFFHFWWKLLILSRLTIPNNNNSN